MFIYIASSWRNKIHEEVVKRIHEHFDLYDYRQPSKEDKGFNWESVDINWKNWTFDEYIQGLNTKEANHGFTLDFNAIKKANVCVLLLPSGRSAHLEAGYFIGAGKKLIIYTEDMQEPELMYKMTEYITNNINQVIEWLYYISKNFCDECNTLMTIDKELENNKIINRYFCSNCGNSYDEEG